MNNKICQNYSDQQGILLHHITQYMRFPTVAAYSYSATTLMDIGHLEGVLG